MLYFAYGSNLNLRHMKRTTPQAQPVSAARLAGYRLEFRGVCSLAADSKGIVQGALYDLTPACMRALDAYEGGEYRKIDVTVETDEGLRTAMAYVMNVPCPIAPPELAYYNIVARGYADWKLDLEPLRRARFATVGKR